MENGQLLAGDLIAAFRLGLAPLSRLLKTVTNDKIRFLYYIVFGQTRSYPRGTNFNKNNCNNQ